MIEFKWLRRRDGKRIIAVSNETAEPPDQIDELIRIVGEDQSAAGQVFRRQESSACRPPRPAPSPIGDHAPRNRSVRQRKGQN